MKHWKLAIVASAATGAALLACGGISDPSKGENSLTLSGALTGADLPTGARVALVWRSGPNGSVTVGADVPVVNGHYSFAVDVPPDGYFFDDKGDTSSGSEPGPRPQSESVGGQVTDPISRAVAGFLVYVDTNRNGQIDPGADQIIGGDNELSLTYFRGGGSLAYEKLRDKTGALPHPGFNLGWTQGWLAYGDGDLTLSSQARLPGIVCDNLGLGSRNVPPPIGTTNYPSPDDPRLHCAANGYSFTYDPVCSPPPVPTLCALDVPRPRCEGGWSASIEPGSLPPRGWPCPIGNTPVDAGAPPPPGRDAGVPPPPPPPRLDAGYP